MTNKAEYYQAHLDRVSRSFAFCIARLEGSLREQVGLGYLICRILDTVEDAHWPTMELQMRAFDLFDQFISERPSAEAVRSWVQTFPEGLPEGESRLLADADIVFADFHSLPTNIKEALIGPVQSMSAGMRHFMERKARQGGRLRLKGLSDVNRYCFFVAGVVGEMLTRLVSESTSVGASSSEAVSPSSTNQPLVDVDSQIAKGQGPKWQAQKWHLQDGIRFGLFLQKINILKDQRGDEEEGRFLVPSRVVVRESLKSDSEAALRYLRSLPPCATSFRLFCAWSLFLGLASLPWIERSHQEDLQIRIPREDTARLLAVVESRILNDEALEELFRSLTSLTPLPEVTADEGEAAVKVNDGGLSPASSADRVLALYQGRLSPSELLEIFS